MLDSETTQRFENKLKEKSSQVTEYLKNYHTQISKYSKVLEKVFFTLFLFPSDHSKDPNRISFGTKVPYAPPAPLPTSISST
jgi:hypothetical protein